MEIETKVMIRLSKRFLIVAALLVLVAGSSAAVFPVLAPNNPKIVYVAICVDSENLNGISPYLGSADPHPILNVSEYSRTVPMTVAAVFSSGFRNSNRDSFGNIFKLSWFAEMDYFVAQSNFVWADGSPAGVSSYTAIRDLLVNNWGTEIQTYSDSIEYHHHFMIYDGTWKKYDNGPDTGYPRYHMYALDHMIIDRNFYPSTWRSGMWIMPPVLSSWLEQWMPFDYTPTSGIYYPVHPSGMDRWQTKCPYAPNVPKEVNSAFAYARDHGSAVFSICTHDKENLKSQVSWLQNCLNTADANEATYPNVSFKYVTAREAMQRALGFTDFTPPTFTITSSDNTYTIVSNEQLWKNHPYIALKYTDGTYGHMSATPTGTNTWTVTPPTSASAIGVAGSDLYGNPGAATFTQGQYTLTIGTMGSGSVTKTPDQATYSYGSNVILAATADPGWAFAGWSGDLSGNTNPTTITMNGNKDITATFTEAVSYTLTVTTDGQGSVDLNPPGGVYASSTIVTLNATGDPGWAFSSWSGDLNGNTNPTTITMDGDKSVTATFTEVPVQYTLTVNIVGSGTVDLVPSGGLYDPGTQVELTANSSAGWSFAGWSGDLGGNQSPIDVVIDGNKIVTATFTQNEYSLMVTVTPAGSGSVNLNNTGPYHYNDVVKLTAIPALGWSFSNWSGDLSSSANPTTMVINGNKAVTATFTQNVYLFSDGFESEDFSAWTSTLGNYAVVETPFHHGDDAAKFGKWQAYATKTLGSSYTTLYARIYFQLHVLPSTGGSVEVLRMLGGSTTAMYIRIVYVTDHLVLRMTSTTPTYTNVDYTYAFLIDTWYCLEIKCVKASGTSGEYRTYLNGIDVCDRTGVNTSGLPNLDTIEVGVISYATWNDYVYIDCCVMGSSYIGPESSSQNYMANLTESTSTSWAIAVTTLRTVLSKDISSLW